MSQGCSQDFSTIMHNFLNPLPPPPPTSPFKVLRQRWGYFLHQRLRDMNFKNFSTLENFLSHINRCLVKRLDFFYPCLTFSGTHVHSVHIGSYAPVRLSIIWRVMEIKEDVICLSHRPKWITPSEISIILQKIWKPNSIIVILFIQNNS